MFLWNLQKKVLIIFSWNIDNITDVMLDAFVSFLHTLSLRWKNIGMSVQKKAAYSPSLKFDPLILNTV